ncbi:hypothetical protein [Acaryochloris sp. IP29b_bin.137]|uniref:hypothetical protein n=1 Tax=Acaryochloris sp. IP29b_bin.137 TaxID=2969217 RepID=UPI002603DD76|nr:hypothetical protein [Acaryochloris sp. IP29b_bin.137]
MEPVKIQAMPPQEIDEAAAILSQALLSHPIQKAVYRSHDQKTGEEIKENCRETLRKKTSQTFVAKLGSQIVGEYRMKPCIGRPFCSLNQLSLSLQFSTVQEREQFWLEAWSNWSFTGVSVSRSGEIVTSALL